MSSLLIKNARVMTPAGTWNQGWLLVRDRQIAALGPAAVPDFSSITDLQTLDAHDLSLLPGFIDVHVHGAMGSEAMDANPDGLKKMAHFYAQHGVTGFLPSTWTDSPERIRAAMEVIAELQGPQQDGATILGAHMEGPYLNQKYCGAQNVDYIRRADRAEAMALLELNTIRLLALAPEYPENHWLITECVRRGITVSAAHTGATYQDIVHAVALGLTQSTHTYNAMTGLHHREPGVVGAAFSIPTISCELIADNIHVHPAAMNVLWSAKGPDKTILISDSIRAAGMPEGDYQIDERTVKVKDGAVRLPDGTLAGSILTLDRAVRNFMAATGQPLDVIWRASSLNAARAIGLSNRKGSLEVGKDADLILVNDQINVCLTVAEGRIVHRNGI